MIHIFFSGLVSSVLLYMHKVDPSITFLIPTLFFPFSLRGALFLTIFLSAAIIESSRYKIPDLVFFLALSVQVLHYATDALIGAVVYSIPVFIIYLVDRHYSKKIVLKRDLAPFLLAGAFLISIKYFFLFYSLFLVIYVPISFSDKKIITLSTPIFIATYLVHLFRSISST